MTIRPTTRDAIIESAFQLLSKDTSSSLADIAKQAGIGRATLHRHFSSRDDLLLELARTALKQLDDAAEKSTKQAQSYSEALELSLKAIVPLADRQWFLSGDTIEQHPEIRKEHQRQMQELADVIDKAKTEGCFKKSIPTQWIAQVCDYLTFAAWEMIRNNSATPEQAAELVWNTLMNGTGVISSE